MVVTERAVVDGRAVNGGGEATALVAALVTARYGHFTAMQVRGGRVRGLGLHLERLEAATAELFGRELDRGLVLDSIRALEVTDGSVRVQVCEAGGTRVLATAGPPVELDGSPQGLMTVRYQRYLPHIKHMGGFPSAHLRRLAGAAGYDEALLTAEDGTISEGAITNLGCFDGTAVVWPEAPMLHGVTMRVLQAELERAGVPQERRVLRPGDLPGYAAVFLTNSWGVMPVDRVDGLRPAVDESFMALLAGCYEAAPWEAV